MRIGAKMPKLRFGAGVLQEMWKHNKAPRREQLHMPGLLFRSGEG